MPDDEYGDAFLDAEEQATRLTEQLSRLAKTLTSYQSSADALAAAGGRLSDLARAQGDATLAISELTVELRRLGIADTQRRLDGLTKTVDALAAAAVAGRQESAARAKELRTIAVVGAFLALIEAGMLAILLLR